MRHVRLGMTIALLGALSPGAAEVVENAVHWVRVGHSAHSEGLPDEPHAPPESEHGCTPTLHLCSCHVTMRLVEAGRAALIPLRNQVPVRQADASVPLDGISSSPYRPPKA